LKAGGTLIISDIHTRYEVINAQIRHAQETLGHQVERVFVLGDFGFFRQELEDWFREGERCFDRPVFCIEGNHEDHAELEELVRDFSDILTHQPRASCLDLGPWKGLCLGGARYMDAASTPRGCEISDADIERCLAHAPENVDLVLTHDCPSHIGVPQTAGLEHYGPTGMPRLRDLAVHFQPRWWFFGHHHRWFVKELEGTLFIGLPRSWFGYVLLVGSADPVTVNHRVEVENRPWWRRLF